MMNKNLISKLVLLWLALFVSTLLPAQINLSNGLVAYYPFNGNANDESGNKNNPVFNNTSLVADRFGKKASAVYFNGKSNYIQIPHSSSFTSQEYSLVAIIQPQGFYNGICYNNAIIDKGYIDYLPGCYSLRFSAGEYAGGDCYVAAFNNENFVGMSANIGGSSSKNLYIKLNTWYCVVFTYSRNSSSMYVNGKLISNTNPNGNVGKNRDDVFIGKKDNVQYPYWFKGVMDEIRFYNRILTSEEVVALCTMPAKQNVPTVLCPEINKPSASFSYSIANCTTVKFESTAKNPKNIKKIKWLFGDGGTSSELAPLHIYKKYGTYKVKAITFNQDNCSDTVLKEIQIKELVTDFVYSEQGDPGKIVFKAKNNNASYAWNLGDGNSHQDESVIKHSYATTGKYAVTLFAKNSIGCKDTVRKNIDITIPIATSEKEKPQEFVTEIPHLESTASLENRDKDVVRSITVENDLLTVSLYDNGIIDGDSVTLIYNDKIILKHQLLKTKPLILSLKIDRSRSSNDLTMYAENLGSIPPNTALMIINDGANRYEVNVSSTKTKNGVISFISRNKQITSSQ